MTDKKNNIAQLLYAAYPSADLLPIDPDRNCRDLPTLLAKVIGENVGDGLFTFMVIEIVEGGESTLAGAIRVMERARRDVGAVLESLRAACIGRKQMPSEIPERLDEKQAVSSTDDLLEACKVLTSYTSDLLYRLDDQVDLSEIDEIRQAKEAITNYRFVETAMTEQFEATLQEQSPDFPQKTIKLKLLAENGQLWIQPVGYGEKCTADGEGSPVGMEIWQDRLRLVVFDDINSEDPRIIDLENARESCRIDAP